MAKFRFHRAVMVNGQHQRAGDPVVASDLNQAVELLEEQLTDVEAEAWRAAGYPTLRGNPLPGHSERVFYLGDEDSY